MSRGLLFAVVSIVLSGLALTLTGCIAPSEGAGVTTSLFPTWTPTAPAGAMVQQGQTTAASTTSTAVAATPSQVRRLTATAVTPTPTPSVVVPTSRPAATPRAQPAARARVDIAGPITLPTVAPLQPGDGRAPVRLFIPALGLDAAVEPMGWHVVSDANGTHSEWDNVDNAAGHHVNSAYPGESGNVVLSGHNNIGGAVFRSVCVIGEPGVDFGLGDKVILVDEDGRRFTYEVNGWQRFPESNASFAGREENAKYMEPTDFAQLTLVTCWPPTSNTHRVIVTGLLTAIEER
jgi:hypothetical protein